MEKPPWFGMEPGTPVPQVDAQDVKAAWELTRDVERRRPAGSEGAILIATRVVQRVCTPGADVVAVAHRSTVLNLLCLLHPEFVAPWMKDGGLEDAVFHAMAQVRMEWMEVGVIQHGPPFDLEHFERLLQETKTGAD
jgi:hypothetical protein